MRHGISLTVVLGCMIVGAGCASPEPNVRLFEWERGVGVQSCDQPDMKMYLWFYEWHMFDAVKPGQHTPGGYQPFTRQVNQDKRSATLVSDIMTLDVEAVRDGAELTLTITNRSDHDWPDLAGIIPCFNPGPQDERNPQFANTNTWFACADDLCKQDKREIHFNEKLRKAIDAESDDGQYVFSHKWPTSPVNSTRGLIIRESSDGQWVTGIEWDDFLSCQGHNPWQCMHLCVKVGPLKKGETKTIRGKIHLFKGTKEDCHRRAG